MQSLWPWPPTTGGCLASQGPKGFRAQGLISEPAPKQRSVGCNAGSHEPQADGLMRLDRSFFELQAAFVRRTAEILDISETDAFRRRGAYPLRSYRYNIWAPAVDSGNAAGCGDLRLIAVAAQTGRYSNRLDELERLIATQQGNADGAPSAGRPRLIADRSASTSRGTAASAEDQAASSRGTGRSRSSSST